MVTPQIPLWDANTTTGDFPSGNTKGWPRFRPAFWVELRSVQVLLRRRCGLVVTFGQRLSGLRLDRRLVDRSGSRVVRVEVGACRHEVVVDLGGSCGARP